MNFPGRLEHTVVLQRLPVKDHRIVSSDLQILFWHRFYAGYIFWHNPHVLFRLRTVIVLVFCLEIRRKSCLWSTIDTWTHRNISYTELLRNICVVIVHFWTICHLFVCIFSIVGDLHVNILGYFYLKFLFWKRNVMISFKCFFQHSVQLIAQASIDLLYSKSIDSLLRSKHQAAC